MIWTLLVGKERLEDINFRILTPTKIKQRDKI